MIYVFKKDFNGVFLWFVFWFVVSMFQDPFFCQHPSVKSRALNCYQKSSKQVNKNTSHLTDLQIIFKSVMHFWDRCALFFSKQFLYVKHFFETMCPFPCHNYPLLCVSISHKIVIKYF